MVWLSEIALETMVERGFLPEFSQEVLDEVASFKKPAEPQGSSIFRDVSDLGWISIDNDDSLDLDQLTFAKGNRLFVAIADVDALVKKGRPIDSQASHNTTSVYTPTRIFPMLPLRLSNDLTSLNEGVDRCAIVVEMEIGEEGWSDVHIYPAKVQNKGKLTYRSVANFLEKKITTEKIYPFLEQLELQDQLAQKIQHYRNKKGTLEFSPVRLRPIIKNGFPVGLEDEKINRAHKLIENSMIATNVSVTHFLNQKKRATLRRVVRVPKKWDRIVTLAKELGEVLPPQPDPIALRAFLLKQREKDHENFPELSLAVIKLLGRGEYVFVLPNEESWIHFDLAELEYAHTTAPNRRFPDLVMQRLLKAALYKEGEPYTNEELATLAEWCTKKEDDADKVERKLIKCAAAMVMEKEIGREFKGMVTGAAPKGTWVRLFSPPIEGRILHGYDGLDVGDRVTVKLLNVDIRNGYIDFRCLSKSV